MSARGGRSVRDEVAMATRLLTGLRRFFDDTPTVAECRVRLTESLARRHGHFLELLRRGVYERPASPYLPLLERAGLEYEEVARLVEQAGIEGTLDRMHDAGVHVTLDEFKGRRPIERAGLRVSTGGRAFDNPLLSSHYEARTSGSRGPGDRFIVDLDLLAHEAQYDRLFLEMFGLTGRPGGLWHPAPPGSAGIKWALRMARLGYPIERWFSQTPVSVWAGGKHAALVRAVSAVSRWTGRRVPQPEHVGLSDAVIVARWLAGHRQRGRPAWLSTTASCAVRACLAARAHGLDISGTFFRSSGEPLSPGKAAVVLAEGCRIRSHYALAEAGRLGVACGRPDVIDEVHVLTDKVAVRQRAVDLAGGARVAGLFLTTLLPSVPKIMLNVELGDYGTLGERRCGCVWDELGFALHLHTIRSYEKLTSEGMHFVGTDLLALVDEILPARFGGTTTDYQFVEEEVDGLPVVSLLVSPRVGPLAAADVRAAVLEALRARDAAHRMMTAIWRDGGTLRVVRREPCATRTGKIHALHIEQAGEART
jgi:hypothetical protein